MQSRGHGCYLVGFVAMLRQLSACKGLSPVLSASGPYTNTAGTRCRILPAVQHRSKCVTQPGTALTARLSLQLPIWCAGAGGWQRKSQAAMHGS